MGGLSGSSGVAYPADNPLVSAPTPPPSPAERVLLAGTPLTTAQLAAMLELAEPAPHAVGVVLPRTPAPASQNPVVACRPAVLGAFEDVERLVAEHRVDKVLVTLPGAMVEPFQRLTASLDRAGIPWRWMPTLADQLAGRTQLRVPRPVTKSGGVGVDPVRMLDRRPKPLDDDAIRASLAGKVVLITGAGGSIGSELARIVCRFEPSRLILVERAENALFDIHGELSRSHPQVARAAVLHDVTDAPATLAMLRRHKPQVIFHAAAHKHVPMMEEHPSAAIENNFYGTRAIAEAADQVGVERFVMISTDKAVNPTSVMGASKRLAELFIQALNARSETTYCMVRFGNVLGSACSVLPIWTRQLEEGGPLTVTHRDMVRYFMTIPEAAGLVLQSAAQSDTVIAGKPTGGGEVFVLDMGEPVRIVDMAERFLRLQGLEPGVDVPVVFTGVRPGEKLFEELSYDGEDMIPTAHQAVRMLRTSAPQPAWMDGVTRRFDQLRDAGRRRGHPWQHASRDAIMAALRDAIPEMRAPALAEAV